MSKYTKYIKQSYKYYSEETQIVPDSDDIIADVIALIETDTGMELNDDDIEELELEVRGEPDDEEGEE